MIRKARQKCLDGVGRQLELDAEKDAVAAVEWACVDESAVELGLGDGDGGGGLGRGEAGASAEVGQSSREAGGRDALTLSGSLRRGNCGCPIRSITRPRR